MSTFCNARHTCLLTQFYIPGVNNQVRRKRPGASRTKDADFEVNLPCEEDDITSSHATPPHVDESVIESVGAIPQEEKAAQPVIEDAVIEALIAETDEAKFDERNKSPELQDSD